MPKKFQGENTKALSARERKAAKTAEERESKAKAAEDAAWQDDDKVAQKKSLRKDEREAKRLDDLRRKQENKLLAEQEAAAEEAAVRPVTAKAAKLTQYQLQQQKQAAAANSSSAPTHLDTPLLENTNRLEEVVSASGVDEAIRVLSVESSGVDEDGRPKRINMAAAFRAFEEARLPSIKKENPTLKLSQLKQRLRKEWQKSPDNPLNQLDR